jgi:hypothetical protein
MAVWRKGANPESRVRPRGGLRGTTPGRVAKLGQAFEDLGCGWCAGSGLSVFKPVDQAGEHSGDLFELVLQFEMLCVVDEAPASG